MIFSSLLNLTFYVILSLYTKHMEGIRLNMDTKIFLLPLDSFKWTLNDENLLQYVSYKRQRKIHSFYFSSDKRHSLYAALLTVMEISLTLNQPISSLIFDIDKNHKPYLKNVENLHFNLSHTKGAVLLGISSAPIGVDIELNRDPAFDIMEHYFHEDEVHYVTSVSSEQIRSNFFFNVWTRKEAFIKYTGNGLSDNLKEINTQSISLQPNFITWPYKSFICSVYTKTAIKEKPIIINEPDIINFFRTL